MTSIRIFQIFGALNAVTMEGFFSGPAQNVIFRRHGAIGVDAGILGSGINWTIYSQFMVALSNHDSIDVGTRIYPILRAFPLFHLRIFDDHLSALDGQNLYPLQSLRFRIFPIFQRKFAILHRLIFQPYFIDF